MAEQDKRTFKYGDSEYTLDDLLKLHSEQENHFYNFARAQGGYNDDAIEGLRDAIKSRIEAVKAGKAFDGDGVLDTDVADNVNIKTSKRGLFKKAKYEKQDNTEWAKYYLNKLVGQLKSNAGKSTGWDESKHSLEAYLKAQGLNAQEIFERYDLQNEDDPEAPRSFDQRRELLKKHFNGYKDWLAGKGFDFTKNDNEWDDSRIADMEAFMANYDNMSINDIAANLRKMGAGDDFTTAFTSDKWDLSKSPDQLKQERSAASERKKQEAIDKAWREETKRRYDLFNVSGPRKAQINQYFGRRGSFQLTEDDINNYLQSQGISRDSGAEKNWWDAKDRAYLANPFDVGTASFILPMKGMSGQLKNIESGDYQGWVYDPSTYNEQRQSVVALDDETGAMQEIFIGHIPEMWNKIKKEYLTSQNLIDPLAAFSKEGGVLEFQTGGQFSSYDFIQDFKKEQNQIRAAETGNTEEVQKARDRVVSNGADVFTSEGATLAQPDAGFSGAEKARLASIAVDIGSIFLTPVAGAVAGAGSSLVNFGADIADDGFQWSDVGNLGINLGLDVLGIIPIFGDTVGTGTKIVRKLAKYGPRLLAGMAAFQGVANFDGMMTSLGKLTSGDKNQKLTVQDWRNISQCIGLVTGTTKAVRGKVAQNKLKKAARVDDMVGIDVYNKQTQKTEHILVDGDVAKKVRAAEGNKQKVEEALGELEDFKGKFGATGELEVQTGRGGLQKPWETVKKADGSTETSMRGIWSEGRAKVSDVYDFGRVRGNYTSWSRKPYLDAAEYFNTKKNSKSYKGAKTSAEIDADVKKLTDAAVKEAENIKASQTRRAERVKKIQSDIQAETARLNEIRTRLGNTSQTTLEASRAQMQTRVNNNASRIATLEQQLNQAQAQLKALEGKKVSKQNKVKHDADIVAARKQVRLLNLHLGSARSKQVGYLSGLDDVNARLQDFKDLGSVQANINRMQQIEKNVVYNPRNPKSGTNAYRRLQSLIGDYRTNHSNIGGRDINWDMKEILKQAGVTKPYKQGGAINRNKLNKFLNYGKG